ncbi:MAG: HAD family phosphatase [Deltaproteobacteria bacterium]|nr:HAD family phosphatase [Deltaproteobacteria bacterium]MBI3295314.1 HAD family phosphatase [Deltaproteobacteria bacterium]
MAKISSIIFDLDGVLIHSATAHEQAFLTILKEIGVKTFHYERYAGQRTDEVFATLLKSASPQEIEALAKKKRKLAFSELRRTRPLVPHCREHLTLFKSRARLALATSSSRQQMELFFELSQTRPLFEVTLCGEDVQRGKPNPEIFFNCATQMNIPPSECLVIEDSEAGIMAALAGGFRVLQIGPAISQPHTLGHIADLTELNTWLGNET